MFYFGKSLSFSDVPTTSIHHHTKIGNKDTMILTIYHYTSWIAHSCLSLGPVGAILNIGDVQFTEVNLTVIIVLDKRSFRYHSKKKSLLKGLKLQSKFVVLTLFFVCNLL